MTRLGTLTDEQLNEAWDLYKNQGVSSAREILIIHYTPLVTTVAKRIGVTLPSHISDEDLVSYGVFGLLDAIEKFDLERSVKFQTYASQRIHGAIIDELRAIDWVPRSVRSQVRSINQATQELETQLQRQPTDGEIANQLEIPIAELHHMRGQQNYIHLGSLDALVDPDGESEYSLMNQLEDIRSDSPNSVLNLEEIKRSLARVIRALDERETVVLALYYYEGLTLAQIGRALRVTESRVCQLHTRAIMAIRNGLAA